MFPLHAWISGGMARASGPHRARFAHPRAFLVFLALAGCVPLSVGCALHPSEPQPTKVAAGEWGGDHVRLTVNESGAVIDFDCAHGKIDGALPLDLRGRFDVVGTFVLEHGGPQRPDETPDSRPARYSGTVAGKEMQLTLTLTEGDRASSSFQLSAGQQARLLKCL